MLIRNFASLGLLFGVAFAAGCDRGDVAPRQGDIESIACGGFAGTACPEGLQCVDDPADDCSIEDGGADCPGICVEEAKPGPIACGGFAGTGCPDGLQCVDDPGDDCSIENGGADCPGVCVEAEKPRKDRKPKKECKDKDREYVSEDPATCAAIRFKCADGQVAFFDDCGCGCEEQ